MKINIRNIAAFFRALLLKGAINNVIQQSRNAEIILSVYFHNPSKKLFEKSVKWFLNKGYQFISVETLNKIINEKLPFPEMAVIFTVDDGWKENKTNIVAVAEKYKIPVCIFISTQPVETGEAYWWSYAEKAIQKKLFTSPLMNLKKLPTKERVNKIEGYKKIFTLDREALTVDELKEISKSPFITIGNHTVTHPILPMSTEQDANFEICEAKKKLENWTGADINFFAYPNGWFTEREVPLLKNSGHSIAFSTQQEYISANKPVNPYSIPRFDIIEDISFCENVSRMTGAWFYRNKSK